MNTREFLAMNAEAQSQEIGRLTAFCYQAALAGGWHNDLATGQTRTLAENNRLVPTRICLIHSELSEAMEGDRKGLMDDKLSHRKMAEVELADAAIRVFDLCGCMNWQMKENWWRVGAMADVQLADIDLYGFSGVLTELHAFVSAAYGRWRIGAYPAENFSKVTRNVFHVANYMGFDLIGAMEEKVAYNLQRADHKRENRLAAGGKAY